MKVVVIGEIPVTMTRIIVDVLHFAKSLFPSHPGFWRWGDPSFSRNLPPLLACFALGFNLSFISMAPRRDARKHLRRGLGNLLLLFSVAAVLPVAGAVVFEERTPPSRPVEGPLLRCDSLSDIGRAVHLSSGCFRLLAET